MSQTIPRRSARLAQKALAPTIPEPVATPQPKRKIVSRSPPTLPQRLVTDEEKAHDIALRQKLLEKAIVIRRALGEARTSADFKACLDHADALMDAAEGLLVGTMDEFFVADCICYCREAKLGAKKHKDAIDVIKVYISCLKDRIAEPPEYIIIR